MAIIIFGQGKKPIGVDEALVRCHSCEKDSWADVMVVGSYFHMFWIPFFPTGKEMNLICKECGLKRTGLPFTPYWVRNYKNIRSQFPHPWYSYLGILLLIFFIVMVTLDHFS